MASSHDPLDTQLSSLIDSISTSTSAASHASPPTDTAPAAASLATTTHAASSSPSPSIASPLLSSTPSRSISHSTSSPSPSPLPSSPPPPPPPPAVYNPDADLPASSMLSARIADLRSRLTAYSREEASLVALLQQQQLESSDIVSYLEREVRRKDAHCKRLMRTMRTQEEEHTAAIAARTQEYESEHTAAQEEWSRREQQLLAAHTTLMREVSDLSLFQRMQTELQTELAHTQRTIDANETRHTTQIASLISRFDAAKQRLLAEAQTRMDESRRLYKSEIRREMDMEQGGIANENGRMEMEREFHVRIQERVRREVDEMNEKLEVVKKQLAAVHVVAYASMSESCVCFVHRSAGCRTESCTWSASAQQCPCATSWDRSCHLETHTDEHDQDLLLL